MCQSDASKVDRSKTVDALKLYTDTHHLSLELLSSWTMMSDVLGSKVNAFSRAVDLEPGRDPAANRRLFCVFTQLHHEAEAVVAAQEVHDGATAVDKGPSLEVLARIRSVRPKLAIKAPPSPGASVLGLIRHTLLACIIILGCCCFLLLIPIRW